MQRASLLKWLTNPRNWLLLFGVGISAGALLGDVILNGTQIGIGPLQIIVAVVGVILIIFSRMNASLVQGVGISLISVVLMILMFEFVLIALGFPTDAPTSLNITMEEVETLSYSPIRACDETKGCHWVQDEMREACGNDFNLGLGCSSNAEGFNNPEDFTAQNVADAEYRILVLGDSFTWGASAPLGSGWVDVVRDDLQASYDNVAVWNAAMPGSGTKQAILTASYLLPIMQPDLVILGFHTGNDLVDNLYPYDRFVLIETEDGANATVQQYTRVKDGVIQETPQVIYYRSLGYGVSSIQSSSILDRVKGLLQRTRSGTLIVGAFNVFNRANVQIEPTSEALAELQTLVHDSDAQFLIMIAPEQGDTVRRSTHFFNAVSAFEQVGVPYVDPIDLLSPDDFENPNPTDKHWNAQGQAIAGQLMIECLSYMIENNWDICPVAMNP